jgi:hypothetical protein
MGPNRSPLLFRLFPQMTPQRYSLNIAHKVSTTVWAFPKGSLDNYPLDTGLKVSDKMYIVSVSQRVHKKGMFTHFTKFSYLP